MEAPIIDIKRKSLSPPVDLLTRAARPEGAKLADPKLQAAVEMFFTNWLIERRLDTASVVFLPESYACNTLAETGTPSAPANGNANVRRFLEVIAAESSKEKTFAHAVIWN